THRTGRCPEESYICRRPLRSRYSSSSACIFHTCRSCSRFLCCTSRRGGFPSRPDCRRTRRSSSADWLHCRRGRSRAHSTPSTHPGQDESHTVPAHLRSGSTEGTTSRYVPRAEEPRGRATTRASVLPSRDRDEHAPGGGSYV